MSSEQIKKLLESFGAVSGPVKDGVPASQTADIELPDGNKFLGDPYKRDDDADDEDPYARDDDEVMEDLVAELTNAYADYIKANADPDVNVHMVRAKVTFVSGRSEVRLLSPEQIEQYKNNTHIVKVEPLSKHDTSGYRIDELEEGAQYKPSTPYGVRYKVFAGREERLTTKEAWFASYKALERGVAKIEDLGNFYEIEGYSYPKEEQVEEADGGNYLAKAKAAQQRARQAAAKDDGEAYTKHMVDYHTNMAKANPANAKKHLDKVRAHRADFSDEEELTEYSTIAPTPAGAAPAVNTPKIKTATKPGDAPTPTTANPSTAALPPQAAKPGDAPNPTATQPSTSTTDTPASQSQGIVDKLGKLSKNPGLAKELAALLTKVPESKLPTFKERMMKSKDFMSEAESKYLKAPESKNPKVELANGKTKAAKHPRMGDGFYGKNSEGKLRFFAGKEGAAKAKEYAGKKDVKESQLDELSPETLKSYRSKAADDYHTRNKRARNLPIIADPDDPAEIDAAYDQANVERAKAKKRAIGMGKAKLKLDQGVDEASDAAMSRAGERDWAAQMGGEQPAQERGEFYIWTMSKGKKKKIAGPFPSEEAAKKSQEMQWGDGVCSGVCESVYHDGKFVDIITEDKSKK